MTKRLAVLRKLLAKPAGLSFTDLLLQTLDGRDVPHEPLLKICAKDPEIRDLGANISRHLGHSGEPSAGTARELVAPPDRKA
jgi:hypothetical protein